MVTVITVADLGKHLSKPPNYWKIFVSKIFSKIQDESEYSAEFDTVNGTKIVINIDKFTSRFINPEIDNKKVFTNCSEYSTVDHIKEFMIPHLIPGTKSYNLPTSVPPNGTILLKELLKSNIKSDINPSSVNNDDGSEIKTETQELISLYYFELAITNTAPAKTFDLFDTWYNILIPETESKTENKKVTVKGTDQYMNKYLKHIVDEIAKDELFVRTSDGGYVIEKADGKEDGKNIFKLSNRAKSWFQNFHKQEQVLLAEYQKPTILPTNQRFDSFKRIDTTGDETNVADWVAKFIHTNFRVELKHWDPADVWLTKEGFFNQFKEDWNKRINEFHGEQAKLSKTDKKTTLSELAEFNISLQIALIQKKIWGISLKKVTGEHAHMTLQNVKFRGLIKMIGKNKKFLAGIKNIEKTKKFKKRTVQSVIVHNNESKYKLESISYSNTANNGQLNFVPRDPKSELPNINCQIRPNGNNLKFEAKYIPAVAQLGQVPVNMMQFALKKELSGKGVFSFSNDYTKYPSTKGEYENTGETPYIMKTKGWKTATEAMVSAIKGNLSTYIANDSDLKKNDPSKYLNGTGPFSFGGPNGADGQKARSNLMIICFLYNLSQIAQQGQGNNDPLHNFCVHMIELAEKIGTAHYEDEEDLDIKDIKFGPFYKIY